MSGAHNDTLYERWIALWNGDLALLEATIAPAFVGHFPPTLAGPTEVQSPQGLARWIQTTLALFDDVRVTIDVGPVVDGDTAVLRWLFRGTYRGGIPTAAPGALGKQIAFNGVDILRVAGDHVVEYWVSSDGLYLMQQLGVIP